MDINTQKKAPLYEALQKFRKQRVVPLMCLDIKEEEEITNSLNFSAKNVYGT